MRIDLVASAVDRCRSVVDSVSIGSNSIDLAESIHIHDLRKFLAERDGNGMRIPYGGGDVPVMTPDPLHRCFSSFPKKEKCRTVILSNRGKILSKKLLSDLKKADQVILICSSAQIDQRFINTVSAEEISLGDFTVSFAESALLPFLDALFADQTCSDLLPPDYYSGPRLFQGEKIPKVLQGGNGEKISRWRTANSLERTLSARPETLRNIDPDLFTDFIES